VTSAFIGHGVVNLKSAPLIKSSLALTATCLTGYAEILLAIKPSPTARRHRFAVHATGFPPIRKDWYPIGVEQIADSNTFVLLWA
jgi:hypothetical protein